MFWITRISSQLIFLSCMLFCFVTIEAQMQFGQQADYIGRSQFFDISGMWENIEPSSQHKISRLHILPTIVNTYRIQPYFALGNTELSLEKWLDLPISTSDLSYVTQIKPTNARLEIMPVRMLGRPQLIVYYWLPDPSGGWTELVKQVMVRKSDSTIENPELIVNASWSGSWLNEWQENVIIQRFTIKEKNGQTSLKVYKKGANQRQITETHSLYKEGDGWVAKWKENYKSNKINLLPIIKNNKIIGVDFIAEETYTDGVPKNVYRQFFVYDAEGVEKEAAEQAIFALTGEWYNMNENGATLKLTIENGHLSLWTNCKKQGGCLLLDRKLLGAMNNQTIGGMYEMLASYRTVEITADLQVNVLEEQPQIIVVNTLIKDLAGIKLPKYRSEVFRRKTNDL